jgi:two-component system response regulator DevR
LRQAVIYTSGNCLVIYMTRQFKGGAIGMQDGGAHVRTRSGETGPISGLSDQEQRVLALISEGLTNRQISERMFLAETTVKNYVSAILAKLGMQRRSQAAAYMARISRSDG